MTRAESELRIVIPSRKSWFIILFLGFWLCGWLAGEVFTIITLFSGKGPSAFLLFWICGWTVGGVFAGLTFLWQINGKEIVVLNGSMLTIMRKACGLGPDKSYALSDVKNLKPCPIPSDPRHPANFFGFFGAFYGAISFDYGMRTVKFGASLDEPEASYLVSLMNERIQNSTPLPE